MRTLARQHWSIALTCLVFLVFALNFNAYRVFGDGTIEFGFVRKLFGEHVDALAYQFGTALLNAPLYGLGKVASAAGLGDIQGNPVGPATVSLSSNLYALGAVLLTAVLLTKLRLPRRGLVLIAALFGTPLFYYAVFSPAYSHATDTFLVTLAVACVYRQLLCEVSEWWWAAAAGGLLGFAATVRYLNAAQALALAVALAMLRYPRAAVAAAGSAIATFGLLLLIPIGLGVPFFTKSLTLQRAAFSPLSPFKMLFSNERGLFVWSPVAVLALVGYVHLVRTRRGAERRFLVVAGAMGAALVVSYGAWPDWAGGWSFSQRFLTSLFPLIAIGIGGAFERWKTSVVVLACLATLWSVFLGFNHVFGAQQSDGAAQIAAKIANGQRPPHAFFELLRAYSRLKYLL